jgi:hypothetical protein
MRDTAGMAHHSNERLPDCMNGQQFDKWFISGAIRFLIPVKTCSCLIKWIK